MIEYCRTGHPGATWFFMVNLPERRGNRLLVERIDVLRTAFRSVRARHPFQLEAVVILPDHLHCVWTLASGDSDFSTRWSLIKGHFSRAIEKGERVSRSRAKRGERGLWQRRFWEQSEGLGWRERPKSCGRGVTRTMRFPSITASYNVLLVAQATPPYRRLS